MADKNDMSSFPLRVDRREWEKFTAVCALCGTNPTNVLRQAVSEYIASHSDSAIEALKRAKS